MSKIDIKSTSYWVLYSVQSWWLKIYVLLSNYTHQMKYTVRKKKLVWQNTNICKHLEKCQFVSPDHQRIVWLIATSCPICSFIFVSLHVLFLVICFVCLFSHSSFYQFGFCSNLFSLNDSSNIGNYRNNPDLGLPHCKSISNKKPTDWS